MFKCLLADTDQPLGISARTSSVAIDIFGSMLKIDAVDALEDYLDRHGITDVQSILGLDGAGNIASSTPSTTSNASGNFKSLTGYTRLEYAIYYSRKDVMPLLARGEDASIGIPLHYATLRGYHAFVKPLLNVGANVNAMDDNGWTVLHWACNNGHYNCLEELVRWADSDVDWDARTAEGKDAVDILYEGVSHGCVGSDELSECLGILQPRVTQACQFESEDTFMLDIPGAFPVSN